VHRAIRAQTTVAYALQQNTGAIRARSFRARAMRSKRSDPQPVSAIAHMRPRSGRVLNID